MIQTIPSYYNRFPVYYNIGGDEPPEPDWSTMPLTFKALSNTNTNYVKLSGSAANWQYKINDGAWQTYTNNSQVTLTSGDTVSFSGTNTGTNKATVVGEIGVYGNLSTAMGTTDMYANQFSGMFSSQTGLVHASGLIIPYTSASTKGLRQMFEKCTNLISPPQVYASGWAGNGGAAMFSGCTALTATPAMNFSVQYSGGNYTLQKMFINCSGMREAKIIGQTTVNYHSDNYGNWLAQFSGCSVQKVEVDWTSWPSFAQTDVFLAGITSNNQYGILIGPASLDNTYKPSNWTRIVKDNGVMTLSSTNRSEYSSKLNSIVTNLVWNDSTNHYDLVFAE